MDQDINFQWMLFHPKMAERAEDIGVTKAKMDFWTMFGLGCSGWAFIAMGRSLLPRSQRAPKESSILE